MSHTYPCLCSAIKYVLFFTRIVGILPIKPSSSKTNHSNRGCPFEISIPSALFTVTLLIAFTPYVFATFSARLNFGPADDDISGLTWYLMSFGYLFIQADCMVTLLLGLTNSKRIAQLLNKISRLPCALGEMRCIARKLKFILILVFALYFVMVFSFFYVAWCRYFTVTEITLVTVLDSFYGVTLRGISTIFIQMQTAVLVMLALLLTTKYQNQAESIKETLEHVPTSSILEEINKAMKTKLPAASGQANILQLQQLNQQFHKTNEYIDEMNSCIGFQLFTTASSNFKEQRVHCSLSILCMFIRLTIVMYMGNKIKTESVKPMKYLQQTNILHLPVHEQQKIHTLFFQWMIVEPKYLTAFNVLNIGPWLLAPIIGNITTYLLVAIQFKSPKYPFSGSRLNIAFISLYCCKTAI